MFASLTLLACSMPDHNVIDTSHSESLASVKAPLVQAASTDPNWVHCADENQTCAFTGTQTVRYGANGVYSTGIFTNGVSCSNSVFGDPVGGVVKSCDVFQGAPATPPAGKWTHCANEGANCVLPGTQTVRYGANGSYASGSYTNSVACSNSVFGDPTPGVVKSCDYLSEISELDPDIFNAAYYVAHYPDLAQLNAAQAQAHWINTGIAQGRQGSPVFWSLEYLALYPGVATSVGPTNYDGAIQNFVSFGRGAVRIGVTALSPIVYDYQTYLKLNPDLVNLSSIDAQNHWLTHGVDEGRAASLTFKSTEYRVENSAALSSMGTTNFVAIQDYVLRGSALNRAGVYVTDPDIFNCAFYSQTSSCTGAGVTTAMQSWVQSGLPQN